MKNTLTKPRTQGRLAGLGLSRAMLARIRALSRQTQTIDRLVIERVRAGLNPAELARRLGCSQSYISKLEDSKDADLKLGEIERYCAALGITVDLRLKP